MGLNNSPFKTCFLFDIKHNTRYDYHYPIIFNANRTEHLHQCVNNFFR